MTSGRLTVVLGYRNRELERVERCLSSLRNQTSDDFRVHFVDYGSRLAVGRSVQALAGQFPFCRYIYTDTRGWPWSRAKALNIGIRLADTEYVLTSDVDMIFAPNFIETVLKAQDKASVVQCAPRWVPETFAHSAHIEDYIEAFPKGGHAQLGGCQCVPLAVMEAIGGFDEHLEYWGGEDLDLHLRLMAWGLSEHWVDDQTAILHQWHPADPELPISYLERCFRPYLKRVRGQLIRNGSDWGSMIHADERPLRDMLSRAESDETADWPALLGYLEQIVPESDGESRWFVTDSPRGAGERVATEAGYRCWAINAPWRSYLLRSEEEIERRVEGLFLQMLESLQEPARPSPGLIVVDLASALRISRDLFMLLLDSLAPGGFLVVANLREERRPFGIRWFYRLLPVPLKVFRPLLDRVWAKAGHRCEQALAFWRPRTNMNNLRDSLYLARIGVGSILDFVLDFPAAGATALFVRGGDQGHDGTGSVHVAIPAPRVRECKPAENAF